MFVLVKTNPIAQFALEMVLVFIQIHAYVILVTKVSIAQNLNVIPSNPIVQIMENAQDQTFALVIMDMVPLTVPL
jgi:hypothetical protein